MPEKTFSNFFFVNNLVHFGGFVTNLKVRGKMQQVQKNASEHFQNKINNVFNDVPLGTDTESMYYNTVLFLILPSHL